MPNPAEKKYLKAMNLLKFDPADIYGDPPEDELERVARKRGVEKIAEDLRKEDFMETWKGFPKWMPDRKNKGK